MTAQIASDTCGTCCGPAEGDHEGCRRKQAVADCLWALMAAVDEVPDSARPVGVQDCVRRLDDLTADWFDPMWRP